MSGAGCQVMAADLLCSKHGESGVVEGGGGHIGLFRSHFLTKFLLSKILI